MKNIMRRLPASQRVSVIKDPKDSEKWLVVDEGNPGVIGMIYAVRDSEVAALIYAGTTTARLEKDEELANATNPYVYPFPDGFTINSREYIPISSATPSSNPIAAAMQLVDEHRDWRDVFAEFRPHLTSGDAMIDIKSQQLRNFAQDQTAPVLIHPKTLIVLAWGTFQVALHDSSKAYTL